MEQKNNLHKMVLSALFLALAYIMPFLTGQIPEFGAMLCPLHIPVLICGFVCGWRWGLAVGFVAPLIRSVTLGMPPLFPTAVCMAFELAAYGFVTGLMHKVFPQKNRYIYYTLIIAMIVGRIIWGIAMYICMGITGTAFTFTAFVAGAFTNAILAIVLQLVLIPVVIMILNTTKVIK